MIYDVMQMEIICLMEINFCVNGAREYLIM